MADGLADPANWLALSLALYLVTAALERAWGDRSLPGPIDRIPPALRALAGSAGFFFYCVSFPYAALLSGLLDLRTLGLAGYDLPSALALGGMVAGVVVIVLLAARRQWAQKPASVPGDRAPSGHASAALAEAVGLQSHLAFYRGLLAMAIGPYGGAFAGLVLFLAERWGAATLRGRWPGRQGSPQAEVLAGTGLLAGTVVFFATNSLAATLLVHFAIRLAVPMPDSVAADIAERPGARAASG